MQAKGGDAGVRFRYAGRGAEQASTQELRAQRLLLHTVETRLAGKPVRECLAAEREDRRRPRAPGEGHGPPLRPRRATMTSVHWRALSSSSLKELR